MPRTTGFALLSVVSSAWLLAALPAHAADEETELWTTMTVSGSVAKNVDASFELSPRARPESVGGDQVLLRFQADYKPASWIALGGGLTHISYQGGDEWRPHQQVILSSGYFTSRTKLEERNFSGAERMELRLRERVQMTLPVARGTSLVVAGEAFGVLRPRNSTGEARLEQWRAQLAVRHRISPQVEVGGGYLLIYYPLEGRPDRIAHVPQIGINFRL